MRWTVVLALGSAVLMAALASGNPDRAYYGTDTRLSGLLLGSALAFGYAPYRIRGRPGRGARYALDVAGVVGLFALGWSFATMSITPGEEMAPVFRGGAN